jgi:magnesium transporter
MRNAFDKLGPAEVERIAELRRRGEFLWIDLTTPCSDGALVGEVGERLGIPERALIALGDFDPARPMSRKFHTDLDQVVFPFFCVGRPEAAIEDPAPAIEPIEVHVLVHGDYVLTLHREPCEALEVLRGQELPEGRDEQYIVYLVLDAMTDTVFEALSGIQRAVEDLVDELTGVSEQTRRRRRRAVISSARVRLTVLRRRIGRTRAMFERVVEAVEHVPGLEGGRAHLERIDRQLDRAVEEIDAASRSLSGLLDLFLSETIFKLTVIATIFLPLTFVTGFFGMNFGWMVGEVDTLAAFLVFGIGSLIVAAVLIGYVISRQTALPTEISDERRDRGRGYRGRDPSRAG